MVEPKGNYLTTLGEKLNPSVQIMWTGDRVISDITRDGISWINERIKRPAYIWWNFSGIRLCTRPFTARTCLWQRHHNSEGNVRFCDQSYGARRSL